MGPLTLVATLLSAFLSTSVSGQCLTPRVRKEWRCLCQEERVAWIKAINVHPLPASSLSYPPELTQFQCLAKLPHDPDFVGNTVDPTISLIPPVNPDSSRYDGAAFPTNISYF